MICRTFGLPGGGLVIACGRDRKRSCKTCDHPNALLLCDGCDAPLCGLCTVSPKKDLDFCPSCFLPAFEHWKKLAPPPADRQERRMAFRVWARSNAEVFLQLSKARSSASISEVGNGH